MFSWVLASTKSPIILEEIWVKTSFVIYLLEKKIRKKAKIEKKNHDYSKNYRQNQNCENYKGKHDLLPDLPVPHAAKHFIEYFMVVI